MGRCCTKILNPNRIGTILNSNAKLQLENWGASIDIFTPFLKQVHSSLGRIWPPLCSQLEGVCGRGEEWMLQTARDKHVR